MSYSSILLGEEILIEALKLKSSANPHSNVVFDHEISETLTIARGF